MFCHKCKCCAAMWWSGFFALAFVGHAVRLVTRAQVQLGDWPVPMGLSIAIVIVAGLLSFILCKKGCGACNCSGPSKT